MPRCRGQQREHPAATTTPTTAASLVWRFFHRRAAKFWQPSHPGSCMPGKATWARRVRRGHIAGLFSAAAIGFPHCQPASEHAATSRAPNAAREPREERARRCSGAPRRSQPKRRQEKEEKMSPHSAWPTAMRLPPQPPRPGEMQGLRLATTAPESRSLQRLSPPRHRVTHHQDTRARHYASTSCCIGDPLACPWHELARTAAVDATVATRTMRTRDGRATLRKRDSRPTRRLEYAGPPRSHSGQQQFFGSTARSARPPP